MDGHAIRLEAYSVVTIIHPTASAYIVYVQLSEIDLMCLLLVFHGCMYYGHQYACVAACCTLAGKDDIAVNCLCF